MTIRSGVRFLRGRSRGKGIEPFHSLLKQGVDGKQKACLVDEKRLELWSVHERDLAPPSRYHMPNARPSLLVQIYKVKVLHRLDFSSTGPRRKFSPAQSVLLAVVLFSCLLFDMPSPAMAFV